MPEHDSRTVTPSASLTPLLEMRGATLMRGGAAVLQDIHLTIQQGEHAVILGPNGSGKSSLIKLITREVYPLMPPDGQPAVHLFGRSQWDVSELRALMGIVTSDLHQTFTQSNGDITAAEAVLSGFFGSVGLARHLMVTDEMRDRAGAALAEMDALPLADRPLATLSTGEARRVLIARALVSQPRALLLDEPTMGLDIAATHHFLQTLRAVVRRGVTLLLVTHHTEEIVPEIERVVLLREGRIFRDGAKREALTSANLSVLFDAPVAVTPSARRGYYQTEIETHERI